MHVWELKRVLQHVSEGLPIEVSVEDPDDPRVFDVTHCHLEVVDGAHTPTLIIIIDDSERIKRASQERDPHDKRGSLV